MVSRVAKNPIEIPSDVDLKVVGRLVTVKGKLGELQQEIHPIVVINQQENTIQFMPANGDTEANAMAGTMSALVRNMLEGVTNGYERHLVMVGVGYRAKTQGSTLNLTVGFSHPVNMEIPKGITSETPSQTEIVIKGADKQKVSQVATNIRAVRPPEPYKGKGIRYKDERISLKEAKKK